MHKFENIASGGTFDMFHDGHKAFLRFQLEIGRAIVLGITSDEYIRKYQKLHEVESFETRKNAVLSFLRAEDSLDRIKIIELNEPFPDEIEKANTKALIVTPNTATGAIHINEERLKARLSPLEIISTELMLAEDGAPISSTRIRNGEISRAGVLWANSKFTARTLCITPKLRTILKTPFGNLIKNADLQIVPRDLKHMVSVGDVTTLTILQNVGQPKLSIVDLIVERKKKYHNIKELKFPNLNSQIKVENKPGHITPLLWTKIESGLFNSAANTVLQVVGEEDLAVLPSILLVPLGWKIFYGQPGEGIVAIDIAEATKEMAYSLLEEFDICTHKL